MELLYYHPKESKEMETTESFYCTKCRTLANKIIAVVPTEMELIWNVMDQCYEIALYNYEFEKPMSVVCAICNNNLLNTE